MEKNLWIKKIFQKKILTKIYNGTNQCDKKIVKKQKRIWTREIIKKNVGKNLDKKNCNRSNQCDKKKTKKTIWIKKIRLKKNWNIFFEKQIFGEKNVDQIIHNRTNQCNKNKIVKKDN